MPHPYVTIDQWRSLNAVISEGGFAHAARKLNRSQSSISYHVAKLQNQLGIDILKIEGRKAVLTEHGKVIYRNAQQLLKDAERLEQLANTLDEGWEASIQLVVDTAFPTQLLMQALKLFEPQSKGTHVQLTEVVLSGAYDAISNSEADLVIGASIPSGYLGEHLLPLDFIAVAHPDHALHKINKPLTTADLEKEFQVIIRDSGLTSKIDIGWLGAKNQWSVSQMETALSAISNGLGYGWLPQHMIAHNLKQKTLKPLPLRQGQTYHASLQLVFGNPDHIGPATQLLASLIKETVSEYLS